MLFCLLAPTVAEYREQVRAGLQDDVAGLVLGLLTVVLGLTAIAAFTLRRRGKDPALLWFAAFALLYGTRLLLDTNVVPFILRMPANLPAMLRSLITYVVPIPGTLFGYEVFPQVRRYVRWVIAFLCAFALAGIAADLITGRAGTLRVPNNIIALLSWGAVAVLMLRYSRQHSMLRPLGWGVLLFGVSVVLGNLRGLRVVALPFDPEPFGFFCFLIALGRVLALRAFENEDRLVAINKELEIAKRIQLSILPGSFPQSQGLAIAAEYRPMTAVAGDFYDFLKLDENRIGVLIADVSGHGVPAALIASMVKVAIAAQLPHADDPALVLSGMNQVLCGKMQGQFVSAAYLFLDLEARKFRYGAGGHPPLLWWREAEQRVESLEENGLILGVMARAPYSYTERPLAKGDRFLLYTDGLVEGANTADEFFGEERVRAALHDSRGATPTNCARALLDRMAAFAGHSSTRTQDDDLTVIVVDTA